MHLADIYSHKCTDLPCEEGRIFEPSHRLNGNANQTGMLRKMCLSLDVAHYAPRRHSSICSVM